MNGSLLRGLLMNTSLGVKKYDKHWGGYMRGHKLIKKMNENIWTAIYSQIGAGYALITVTNFLAVCALLSLTDTDVTLE